MRARVRACARARARACVRACVRVCVRVYARACVCTRVRVPACVRAACLLAHKLRNAIVDGCVGRCTENVRRRPGRQQAIKRTQHVRQQRVRKGRAKRS
eukprot:6214339-Pleurochrysis_carterae.AAC.2